MDPALILRSAAETFEARSKVYGPNYKNFGVIMSFLFPKGLPNDLTEGDWNRLGVIVHCVTKLARYCNQMEEGGHQDSAHDLIVYAALLEALTLHIPTLEERSERTMA